MKYQIGEVVRVRWTGVLRTIIDIDDDGLPVGYLTVADGESAWYKESALEPVNGGMPKHRYNFLSDEEKMYDFLRISKEEFLASYSYLTEEEYDATTEAYRALSQVLQDWTEEYKKESVSKSISMDDIFVAIRRLSDDDHGRFVKAMFRGMSLDQISAGIGTLCNGDFEAVYREMERESQRRDAQQQRQLAGAIASSMDAYLRKVGDNRDFYTRAGEYMSMQDMYDAIVNEFDLTAQ